MIILRLVYAADLPDPSDILKKIKEGKINIGAPLSPADQPGGGDDRPQLRAIAGGGAMMQAQPQTQSHESPDTLQAMIKLFEDNGEVLLAAHLFQDIACVTLKSGHFEFKSYENAPADLAGRVRQCLSKWTGDNWMVSVVRDAGGAQSLSEIKRNADDAQANEIKLNPNIKAVLDTFPDAKIIRVFNNEEEES